jgi:hypothetical protein
MPISFPNIIRNITLLCAEGLGAGMLVLIGASCASLTAMPALSAALGYGIAVLVITALLVLRTGAMLNTGATLLKVAMWIFGLDSRQYFTSFSWVLHADGRVMVPRIVPWQWLLDVVMGALYMGFQIGGAMLGVLLLRELDRTGLLAGSVMTKPNGNLAGDDKRAFVFAYLLNSFVLTMYGAMTSNSYNYKVRQVLSPVIVGLAVFVAVFAAQTYGVGTVISFPSDLALAILVPSSRTHLWISATAAVGGALTAFMFCWWMNFLDRMLVDELYGAPWMRAHSHVPKHADKVRKNLHQSYHEETGRVLYSLLPVDAYVRADESTTEAAGVVDDLRL